MNAMKTTIAANASPAEWRQRKSFTRERLAMVRGSGVGGRRSKFETRLPTPDPRLPYYIDDIEFKNSELVLVFSSFSTSSSIDSTVESGENTLRSTQLRLN